MRIEPNVPLRKPRALLRLLLLTCLSCGCDGVPSGTVADAGADDPGRDGGTTARPDARPIDAGMPIDGGAMDSGTPPPLHAPCEPLELAAIPDCDETAYYVDVAGDDANAGSNESPWQSLAHARDAAPGGATICVRSGEYGRFEESLPPSIAERQVIRAAPGHTPVLTRLDIDYDAPADARLTLSGFAVAGPLGSSPVYIENTRGLRLHQIAISSAKWAVDGRGVSGMDIRSSQDFILDRSRIESVFRGLQIRGCERPRILGNRIVVTQGTGIQYLGGNVGGEIAYNHITASPFDPNDVDAVVAPHASIISIRSGDLVIRGNHLHGMGSSSGVMFYEPDAAGGEDAYSNVLIENNAIYDPNNTYVLRVYNLGSDFIVRNNTIFNNLRSGDCDGAPSDARYRYNVALIVHNLAPGASGIQLYNNVFGGIVSVAEDRIEAEANNYVWSWNASEWLESSPSGTSEILTPAYGGCGTHDTRFEEGSFFEDPLDPSFPARAAHEFQLGAASPGRNFGDPSLQPASSLGSLDPNGFVNLDGACRDAAHHSVGAYERGD